MVLPMRVPAVMVTQDSDSASTYVSFSEEPDEAVSFLAPVEEGGHGFDELMVDFKGKMTPCNQVVSIVARLIEAGVIQSSKVKVTPRMPTDDTVGLRRTAILHSIIEANYTAYHHLNENVVEEVIHPVGSDVRSLVRVEANFNIIKNYVLESSLKPVEVKDLQFIPSLDNFNLLVNAADTISSYVNARATMLPQESEKVRVYLARENISAKFGMLPSALALRLALSKLNDAAKSLSVPVYPILECGPLPLRGNLNHESKDSFLRMYGGVTTVAVPPSLIYDSGKKASDLVKSLKDELQGKSPPELSGEEEAQIRELIVFFACEYARTVSKAADVLMRLASLVPERREASISEHLNVNIKELEPLNVRGISMELESFTIPSPVKYTALMYSFGAPPELVGVGRALSLLEKKRKGLFEGLFDLYPSLEDDISSAWRYLCLEAARKVFPESFISDLAEDIRLIKEFLSPKENYSAPHRALSMMISEYAALKSVPEKNLRDIEVKEFIRNEKLEDSVKQLILQAGRIRGALG
ncbi:MAG: phosphoenolpyruvate carboxylase [Candidatus Freyarchaeota archaeon]|nr:phosphoenolpyruvate carboxylase [Candidatus Jordarchaeia archaeon]